MEQQQRSGWRGDRLVSSSGVGLGLRGSVRGRKGDPGRVDRNYSGELAPHLRTRPLWSSNRDPGGVATAWCRPPALVSGSGGAFGAERVIRVELTGTTPANSPRISGRDPYGAATEIRVAWRPLGVVLRRWSRAQGERSGPKG